MLQVLYTGWDGVKKCECETAGDVLAYLKGLEVPVSSLITIFDYVHNGSMTSTKKVLIRAIEAQPIESLLRYRDV